MLLDKGLSDTQHKEIVALLDAQIQENVGMAMVFTLCEAVREYLVEHNHKGNVREAERMLLVVRIVCSRPVVVRDQDGSEYQDMLRRLEIKKKKDDKEEADKIEKVRLCIRLVLQ